MKEELLATAGTTLVNADPHDTLLGIGISMQSQEACEPQRWHGKNILGQVLTDIRNELLSKIPVMSLYMIVLLL